ncbi:MAG: hypothetical protein AB4368_25760 [Xenococcaceae cyanobacterium]
MNQLAKVLLFYRNGLAVITSAVIMSFLAVEVTKAQPKLSCFMIDTSGEVINLADICNLKSDVATPINHDINSEFTSERTKSTHRPVETVYSVGDGSVPFTLGTSSAIYYSGKPLVYVRRYREAQRFNTRDNVRNYLIGATNSRRVKFSGRIPFIIYRYQK